MPTADLKLHDIFRIKFRLSEPDAREVVQKLQETIQEQQTLKHEHTVEIINKDIKSLQDAINVRFESLKNQFESLKDHIDIKFATKEELAHVGTKIERSKSEMVKWMFLFWIGQVVTTFGFILLFLKK